MKQKQLGITLIESIATLGIMSAVAVGTVYMSGQYTADTRTTGAAEHMRVIADAAQAYVRDHRANILAQATDTTPVMLSVATLSAAGYLQPGVSSTNAFRQDICALVLEPSAGALNTLLVAEGGDPLDDVTLAHFATQLGAGGGGRFTTNGTQLQGAGGGWSLPVSTFNNRANTVGRRCDGATPGAVQIPIGTPVYAQWMNATEVADPGFLARDIVPGNPTANTMKTHINMGGNRITNLNTVNAGGACGAGVNNGEIATGSRNEVLVCNAGTWERQGMAYMGGTVTNFSNLPPCNASNMGETRRVSSISGMFVCSGIRWDAALNESNNFVLPQHLQVAGNATISGAATIGGNASIAGNTQINGTTNLYGATTTHATLNANAGVNVGAGQSISSAGRLHIESGENLYLKPWNANGQVIVGGGGGSGNLTAAGNIQANGRIAANGRITAGEYVQLNGVATEGAGCSPNGLLARDGAGAALSCESGRWGRIGGGGFWAEDGARSCVVKRETSGGFRNQWYYDARGVHAGRLYTGILGWYTGDVPSGRSITIDCGANYSGTGPAYTCVDGYMALTYGGTCQYSGGN